MLRETLAVGPLGCNCSLLIDEASKEALVVDPGGDGEKVAQRLQALGAKVKAIVITHAHIDHLCGIPAVQAATGAPVWLNAADRMLYEHVTMQAQMLGFPAPTLPDFEPRLTDGRGLAFGAQEAGVLFTPGHTPGSVCFHLGAQKLVLTGDTLFAGSVGRTDLWGGDQSTLMRSLAERLMVLADDTVVVPGHGPETTIGDERRHNPFLRPFLGRFFG